MDVEALTSAALKFALMVSNNGQEDDKSGGSILVKHLKVFFVVLSDGRLREKLMYLYRQFADANTTFMTK